MRILIRMRHGLGDNAQFTIVLRHIKRYFPNWEVDMVVGHGKDSYFKSFTNKLFLRADHLVDERDYKHILDVHWPVGGTCSKYFPSTKPTEFLKKVLKIKPIETYFKGYHIDITDREHELADSYVENLPNSKFVLLHYMAKTLKHRKSLTHDDASFLCLQVLKAGYTPVILDWNNESPLPDQRHIFNPGRKNPLWGDGALASGGSIAALIQRASLYIGIDSGPLHIAGCTDTPAIGIWYGHHPINFFDLCDNVTHLVPAKAKSNKYIKGKKKTFAKQYFEKKYKHIYYKNLATELKECIGRML